MISEEDKTFYEYAWPLQAAKGTVHGLLTRLKKLGEDKDRDREGGQARP